MPRREARVQVTIWSNRDFAALSQEDQRTYFLAFCQPGISLCGVLPMTLGRWSGMAIDTNVDSLRASIGRLEAAGFVVADYEKDELFVRSFMRHDGVWRNSKTRGGALQQIKHVTSPKIKAALSAEVDRLRLEDGASDGAWDDQWAEAFPSGMDGASDGLNRDGIRSQESPPPPPPPSPSPSPLADVDKSRHSREGLSAVGRAAQDAYFGEQAS